MPDSATPRPVTGADRVSVFLLGLVGLYVLVAPGFLGWDFVRQSGNEQVMLRIFVGFGFLFQAAFVLEKNRLRRQMYELFEALNMLLYGKDYRRHREAIRILLAGLDSKNEEVREKAWKNLRELTGQDFALDAEIWRAWWAANEKRFALKTKRPE